MNSRSIRDHYRVLLPLSVSYRDVYPTHARTCCRLLGWSAFAGFFILLLGWPLNSFLTKRSIRIQKGVMTARDKRMGVLNELIGAVSYYLLCDTRWLPLTAVLLRSNSSSSLRGKLVGSTAFQMREPQS